MKNRLESSAFKSFLCFPEGIYVPKSDCWPSCCFLKTTKYQTLLEVASGSHTVSFCSFQLTVALDFETSTQRPCLCTKALATAASMALYWMVRSQSFISLQRKAQLNPHVCAYKYFWYVSLYGTPMPFLRVGNDTQPPCPRRGRCSCGGTGAAEAAGLSPVPVSCSTAAAGTCLCPISVCPPKCGTAEVTLGERSHSSEGDQRHGPPVSGTGRLLGRRRSLPTGALPACAAREGGGWRRHPPPLSLAHHPGVLAAGASAVEQLSRVGSG